MSSKERLLFEDKQKNDLISVTDEKSSLLSSLASIVCRPYLYCLCFYMIVHLTVYYPEFLAIPFFFNEFLGADTDFLAYLTLGLSLTNALSVLCWRHILTVLDKRFSWLSCRMSLMIIPLIFRSVNIAILPFIRNVAASISVLVVNNLLSGSAFSGGVITLTYELDPFKSPVVFAIMNGVGEASGFLVPLIRALITRVDQEIEFDYLAEYERRWRWFFMLCGGLGLMGVVSLAVGLLGCRNEWKKHPSLIEKTVEKHQSKREEKNDYVVLDQNDSAA
jgi:MFS family permease